MFPPLWHANWKRNDEPEAILSSQPALVHTLSYVSGTGILLLLSLYILWPGLNPSSLWLDDLWVGVLVKSAPLSFIFSEHFPLAPGFVLVLKFVTSMLGFGSWQLQIVPLLSALVQIPLIVWVGYQVTGRVGLGLFAAVLLTGSHTLAVYSLRVKQPSADSLATLLILSLTIACLQQSRRRRFAWLMLLSAAASFVSFPAIFSAVVFVNLAGYRLVMNASERSRRPRYILLVSVLLFDLASAIYWYFLLRGRLNAALVNSFNGSYLPLSNPRQAMAFLRDQGYAFFGNAFPDGLSWLAVFAPVGFYYLVRRHETRSWAVGIPLVYFSVFFASFLRMYPLGTGRTDVFSYPLTILLVTAAAWALCQELPAAWLVFAAAAFCLLVSRLPASRVKYPYFGDREVVERLEKMIADEDGLIVYPFFNFAMGCYSTWPYRLIKADDSSIGFYVDLERKRTIVLHESYQGLNFMADPSVVTKQLQPFFRDHFNRVFFVGTTGEWNSQQWIIEAIEAKGYRLDEAHCQGHLRVFKRTPPTAALSVGPG